MKTTFNLVSAGYDTPQNLAHYAFYLDSRVRAYRDLKHDAVRVQSESNRDMRVSQSIEDSRVISSTVSGPKRSKTIMGRKLRSMTVEKGLLRETKAVHRMIDALVECKASHNMWFPSLTLLMGWPVLSRKPRG